jgi:rod shape-determining protein MreC
MSKYRNIQDMKLKSSTAPAIAIRPKHFMSFMAVLSLATLAVALIVTDKNQDNIISDNIRYSVQNVTLPAIELFSNPAQMLQELSDNFSEITTIYERNKILAEQNKMLLKWQTVATQLEQENAQLRKLLNVQTSTLAHNITAQVMSSKHDSLSHSLIVRHNGDSRIKVGSPLISPEGMVGYVLKTKGEIANVLLISDRGSRIPVAQEQNGERGILTGLNDDDLLLLEHVDEISQFRVGDRIITSQSELFPISIAVGEVAEIKQNKIYVRPYVNSHKMRFANIVVGDEKNSVAE